MERNNEIFAIDSSNSEQTRRIPRSLHFHSSRIKSWARATYLGYTRKGGGVKWACHYCKLEVLGWKQTINWKQERFDGQLRGGRVEPRLYQVDEYGVETKLCYHRKGMQYWCTNCRARYQRGFGTNSEVCQGWLWCSHFVPDRSHWNQGWWNQLETILWRLWSERTFIHHHEGLW